jgi:SAM-dependent methyltransferase
MFLQEKPPDLMEENSSFYSSISQWYDEIFPYKPGHLQFIYDHSGRQGQRHILDMGCATGSMALALVKDGHVVYGIDDDKQMIRRALDKRKGQGLMQYPVFEQLDMTRAGDAFEAGSFDVVTCFGNTLVHLPNEQAIDKLMRSVHRLLKPGGHFLFQILHYDYILEQGITELPRIETNRVVFERQYEYRPDGRLDFLTRLYVRIGNQVIHNRVPLYPIGKRRLLDLLQGACFEHIHLYGSFNGEPLTPESMPLVVGARKKRD